MEDLAKEIQGYICKIIVMFHIWGCLSHTVHLANK